jgi:hypothetical protein
MTSLAAVRTSSRRHHFSDRRSWDHGGSRTSGIGGYTVQSRSLSGLAFASFTAFSVLLKTREFLFQSNPSISINHWVETTVSLPLLVVSIIFRVSSGKQSFNACLFGIQLPALLQVLTNNFRVSDHFNF